MVNEARSLQNTAAATTTGTTKYVLNANNADIVVGGDYVGYILNGETVDNHCAPTAGTNIIKYWGLRRGVTGLYYHSDWWVLSSLCVNMKTVFHATEDQEAGTTLGNCYNGLKKYCNSTRGIPYASAVRWGNTSNEECTFAKAKSYINANIPFIMMIPGHAQCCFGYSTASGYNQVILATGNHRGWVFRSFTANTPNEYQYISNRRKIT